MDLEGERLGSGERRKGELWIEKNYERVVSSFVYYVSQNIKSHINH